MALNPRENINGVTPQDLNKMNNNFMSIWKTLFGGLDFSDTNSDLKKKIQTQQMPVQGEGNFDKNYPLYIRFYVPNNTKSVTKSSFNMICERYRMDSSVTSGGGKVVNAPIQMSLASATGAVASVSGGGSVSYVRKWGYQYEYPAPSLPVGTVTGFKRLNGGYYTDEKGTDILAIECIPRTISSTARELVDLSMVQHSHEIAPHSHNITMQPHTHTGSASITIPEHTHNLNEGIKVSSQDALGVIVELNGKQIATLNSANNPTANEVDCTDAILVGQWNTIKCTTSNLARITIYGIIELVMNY